MLNYKHGRGNNRKDKKMSKKIIGHEAIEYKKNHPEMELNKYNDPIEGELFDLSVSEAEDIAGEDPNLIYIEID